MSTEPNSPFVDDPLSAVDARILGSLVEKQATTPETYPLTLNALVLACNQKTSRDPVMNLTPGQVGQSLRQLEGRGLVRLVMGSRADRWEHTLGKGLELVAPQVALLGLLFLRGPQTLNELLTRSNRLHDFDDVEQIRHHLERLAGRGLAVHLERRAGQREERYMHLLGRGRRGGDGQRPGARRAGRSVGRCGSADRRAGDAPGGAGGAPGQARRRGVISREGAIGDMQVPADNRERLFALRPQ
ncbi:hypothetical protein K652_24121 [Pseudomonas aeruginosa VRFPA02]|nr:hypothetical protein K652_24121 [Pseudomonas aeruginosa VRFPA02]